MVVVLLRIGVYSSYPTGLALNAVKSTPVSTVMALVLVSVLALAMVVIFVLMLVLVVSVLVVVLVGVALLLVLLRIGVCSRCPIGPVLNAVKSTPVSTVTALKLVLVFAALV